MDPPLYSADKRLLKEGRNHAHSVALFALYIPQPLRTTPAMAANVTKRLWEIGDIVACWKRGKRPNDIRPQARWGRMMAFEAWIQDREGTYYVLQGEGGTIHVGDKME